MTAILWAEVGGKRICLKAADFLLMPMKTPHRWNYAGEAHSGSIHLCIPEVRWTYVGIPNQTTTPQSLEQRKAQFEKHGTTLLGDPLSKKEIDNTF
ncbi:MAG: hypothetical protein WCB11_24590 [Terriglobales bacterium]